MPAFLTPLGEHQLVIFWVQLVVLLAAARGLGALARRFGQPAVVGELGAGILVGPTVLGTIAPDAARWLFPGDPVQSALLLGVSWIGIVLLLLVTGFETDLALLRRLGRQTAAVATGSLVVPLALGFGLGLFLPDRFLGPDASREGFALFVAVALSVSALPVVARILNDMRLLRRDIGQIILAAGMANDLIGWILLGVVSTIAVGSGGFSPIGLLTTVVLVIGLVVATLTVGQRLVDSGLRHARGAREGFAATLTVTVLVTLLAGGVTAAMGMEAVLGAFVAGIVLGRSRYQRDDVKRTLQGITSAVFAPLFFATAGLYLDLRALGDLSTIGWVLVIIAIAAVTKLVGSMAGARWAGLERIEGLAIGIGLNARGALEIVVATIGLGLGVLNDLAYAAIVVMALVTSMAAPPLLRPVLRRVKSRPEESARLEREELMRTSVVARTRAALLPSRGGLNSALAARTLDLALQPEASLTVLSIGHNAEGETHTRRVQELVLGEVTRRRAEHRHLGGDDPGSTILSESLLGYDLIAVGLNDDFAGSQQLSGPIRSVLTHSSLPVLLVRRSRNATTESHTFRRLLVPAIGTRVGRGAEELAFVIAASAGAEVDAVHVLPHATSADTTAAGAGELARAWRTAQRFGGTASPVLRSAPSPADEIIATANDLGSDTIVVGAQIRSQEGIPFLGHSVERLLAIAPHTLIVLAFPGDAPGDRDDGMHA